MPIYIGTSLQKDIRIGTTPIQRVYVGTALVYSRSAVPNPPAAPRATSIGFYTILWTWTAPADNGSPIIDYDLEVRENNGAGVSKNVGNVRQFRDRTSNPGQLYGARVRAANADGESAWSAWSANARQPVPNTPGVATFESRSTDLIVWKLPAAPAAVRGEIIGYSYQTSTGVNGIVGIGPRLQLFRSRFTQRYRIRLRTRERHNGETGSSDYGAWSEWVNP